MLKRGKLEMLAYKSAKELAKLIKDKEISSFELLEYYIARVEKFNPDINAILSKIMKRLMKQPKKLMN